jgi:hypothetical protein
MKLNGLISAALVLAALCGVLYWSNHRKPADDTTKPATDAPPKILSLTQSDISQLVIKRKGEPEIGISKNVSGLWQITAPKPLPADQDAVSQMLATISILNSDRLVDDKASDLAQYGLADPAVEIDVTAKDKTQKLMLGEQTVTGSGSYAALVGDPRVFTISSYNKTSLDKTAGNLRDKRLLTADFDKVTQIELLNQTAGKKLDIAFARDKDTWQIVRPKPYRATGSSVEDLVRSLKDAKFEVSPSGDDAKTASEFASASPYAEAKITGAAGNQELQIRKTRDDYYAKSSVDAGAFKITNATAAGLDKSLDDFRNKKLFDFGYADPDKIEIHDGGKSCFLTHSGSDWWGPDGKKLDATTVQPLLDKIRNLSADKFPESGFASPIIEITVISDSSKRTEKVALAKSGEFYIAKRENEPALYELAAAAITDLQQAASGLKPVPPPAAPSANNAAPNKK